MPTLTPTNDTGATGKVHPLVYLEPDRAVTDADLAAQLSLDGLNGAFIADFLSACLTHERCGTHLYRSVSGRTANPVLQARYEEFGRQTLRHVEILEDLIVASGGNPSYVSPLARAVEGADSKALEATFMAAGGLDPMAAEMAMLDAVFMAETVDHANWDALGQLAEALPKGALRDRFAAAVAEVEEQEDEHLTWARDTRARLTLLQASSSLVTKATAKAEELVAQVRGWFSSGNGASPAAAAPRKRTSGTKAAPRRTTARQATAKKATTKKATTKKTAAKKTAAKRTTTKKTAAKKTAAKKTTARTTTAKKASTKKPANRKASAKKQPARKATRKQAPAKLTSASRSR